MDAVRANKARVAFGGAKSIIGTVVPLDQNVVLEEGLEVVVAGGANTADTGPSLGAAAVCSALPPFCLLFTLQFLQTDWCNFCRDFAEIFSVCTKCKYRICLAPGPGKTGCVRQDTLVVPKDQFLCPDCSAADIKVSKW
jgi:hypothetical protein